MSESFLQVAPDSTGKQLRAILRTVLGNQVYDEVIELADTGGNRITPLNTGNLVSDITIGSGFSGIPAIAWNSGQGTAGVVTVDSLGNLNVVVSGFNQAPPIPNDNLASQGNISALNGTVTWATGHSVNVGVAIYPNPSFSGTVVFEVQLPASGGGTSPSWYGVSVRNLSTGQWQTTSTGVGTFSYPMIPGVLNYRVRASAFTSGTMGINFSGNEALASTEFQFAVPPGQPIPPEAVYLGGSDGTNLRGVTVKNANPATTDYGAFIRSLFQQAPGSAVPLHAAYLGASDGTNLQGLLVESAGNPNLLTGVRQGANQLGINTSGQIAISNFPATQPVSGTVAVSNLPATQPVSGTVNSLITDPTTPTNQAGVTPAGQLHVVQDYVQTPKFGWGVSAGWGNIAGW